MALEREGPVQACSDRKPISELQGGSVTNRSWA